MEAALGRLGLNIHVERTRSLDHARELALAAAQAGETAVAFGGDGLIGAVADALRHTDGVLGVLPGGRGNDFARMLGIPGSPPAACDVLARGELRRVDLGLIGDRTFIGIASCGFDSVANRIANETKLVHGRLVYAYGLLRALAGWRPATFTIIVDGGDPRTVSGYTVAVANSRYYGGGMMLAPEATLDDGMLDVVMILDTPKLRFLRRAPTVFTGAHVRLANVEVVRGRTIEIAASRPFTMYADGDPIADLPVTVGVLAGAVQTLVPASDPIASGVSLLDVKIAAARAVGELARRAGRGGGTSLPGKVLTRLEPRAIEQLAGRLPRGCAVISATNGKTTSAAMAAAMLERAGTTLVHNRAGANMAGGVASDSAAGRPAWRRDRRPARAVRARRVLA